MCPNLGCQSTILDKMSSNLPNNAESLSRAIYAHYNELTLFYSKRLIIDEVLQRSLIFILNFFHSQITFFKCSAKCAQHFNTTYCNLCCAQHIALVWPPFCNILQDVGWWNRAEKCVLHVVHDNVAICCLNWKAACVWLGL